MIHLLFNFIWSVGWDVGDLSRPIPREIERQRGDRKRKRWKETGTAHNHPLPIRPGDCGMNLAELINSSANLCNGPAGRGFIEPETNAMSRLC